MKNQNKKPWHAQFVVRIPHKTFAVLIDTPETYTREDAIYDGMLWMEKIKPLLPSSIQLTYFGVENSVVYSGGEGHIEELFQFLYSDLNPKEKEAKFMQKYAPANLKESLAHRKIRLKEEHRQKKLERLMAEEARQDKFSRL